MPKLDEQDYLTILLDEGEQLLLKHLFHQSEISTYDTTKYLSKVVETLAHYKNKEKQ